MAKTTSDYSTSINGTNMNKCFCMTNQVVWKFVRQKYEDKKNGRRRQSMNCRTIAATGTSLTFAPSAAFVRNFWTLFTVLYSLLSEASWDPYCISKSRYLRGLSCGNTRVACKPKVLNSRTKLLKSCNGLQRKALALETAGLNSL